MKTNNTNGTNFMGFHEFAPIREMRHSTLRSSYGLQCVSRSPPFKGRGWGWGLYHPIRNLITHSHNFCHHSSKTSKDLFIAETNDADSLSFEVCCALVVIIVSEIMRRAIQFDTQTNLGTIEIKNERTYALLPPEFPTTCTATAQCTPKCSFSWSEVITQRFAPVFIFGGIGLSIGVVHRWAFTKKNVDMVRLLFMYHNITDPTPNPSPTREGSGYRQRYAQQLPTLPLGIPKGDACNRRDTRREGAGGVCNF